MRSFDLTGNVRTGAGKKVSKGLRKAEMVPCVLYGQDTHLLFSVAVKDLKGLVYTPYVQTVNLSIEEKKFHCIVQEIQFHPVSDKILHVDFYQIVDNQEVTMVVPVKLVGFAEGVKAGGKLSHDLKKLKIKALPKNLVDIVEVDVTDLGLGKTIRVGDLTTQDYSLLDTKNVVVASVKVTRASKELEAAAAPAKK
jgi:large subunit ribosomal protein L25